jgi:prolyl 4-hydroxylase
MCDHRARVFGQKDWRDDMTSTPAENAELKKLLAMQALDVDRVTEISPGAKDLNESPAWTDWLALNMSRGCDIETLINVLIDNNFTPASIFAALSRPQKEPAVLQRPRNFKSHGRADIDSLGNDKIQWLPSEKIELFTIEDVLSRSECQTLIDLCQGLFRTSGLSQKDPDETFRTSETADLLPRIDPVISKVNERLARCVGLPLGLAEPTQIQRYQVGQQFKSHTDFFEPYSREYAEFCSQTGNRTWTFMVYLNDGCEGGETHFDRIDMTFRPTTGMGLAWNNRYSDGSVNYDTLHAGKPVLSGEKYVITQWFREQPMRLLR